ncbi:uncharacterized protein N7482_005495 [Penicillium canariense]|uniref:Uncharacterized protein n=1 Tax=Penicillium canariense TaxID=189055 RepID=A0A9W9I4X6_9EURO|nr:uncharacterized protein N7482_005495 [Penicillium canariense]KAJ5166714.1 hypothetical protein N7482_005495 [Penicillium canariense]
MVSTLSAVPPKPPAPAPQGAGVGTDDKPRASRPQQKLQESWSSDSSANAVASESPSHYSSFSSDDSDEHIPDSANEVDEDDAIDVVGVSIGREQSRMKARATPAEEKTRVLEQQGEYFTDIPDAGAEDGLFVSQLTAEPESVEPKELEAGIEQARVARTTRRAPATHPVAPCVPVERHAPRGPHKNHSVSSATVPDAKESNTSSYRSSFTRSLLKTSLPRRPRAWSGELKRFLPDLGSLARRPSLSFRSTNAHIRARSQTVDVSRKRSPVPGSRTSSLERRPPQSPLATNGLPHDEDVGDDAQPISELRTLDGSSAVKHSFTRRPSTAMPGRPPSLRRSSSDQSLYLRASSTASSLEQRPLYQNVHSQVNSRFKAIKDSLQDSSSRLLSMPTLHLQDIRTDWTSRPFFNESGNSSTSVNADRGMNGSARRTATPPPPPRNNSQSIHPILEEAMSELTGDVVILGGYRGSILRSAKPPHRQLWVPMKVGLNLRKVDLEVGLTREDEERMEETIIPSGVLSHIGPVDVCRRLMKRLRKCDNAVRGDLRVWDYGYDWRLSPELLSQRLIAFLEGLPCNRPAPEGQPQRPRRGAIVIAHSLGGLITRHAVNERPDLFAGVVYAGVPQHCVNILGPLRNGDDVLLSSRVLTAQVNFTFRTSFALLPENGHCFINKQTQEEYRVDFFNADNWDKYHLSPCIRPALPATAMNIRFKDLALMGKRFSLGPREDSSEVNFQDIPDLNDPQGSPANEGISTRSPRPSAHTLSLPTPTHIAASASDKVNDAIAPGVDGIVGPVSNPRGSATPTQTSTTSTIPRAAAMEYLQRTLAEVKRFKSELNFQPTHQSENRYPPAAVLYGKSVPTLYGARVTSREAIKYQDAYDDLAFAAGDGVCLATAAMLPPGYRIIKDGLVKSDRGHVGLLGDLEGVGQCLRAVIRGRKEGVGLGSQA